MKMLRDFWDKQGRILLLLAILQQRPRSWTAFLNEVGRQGRRRSLDGVRPDRNSKSWALIRDVYARFLGNSPITKTARRCPQRCFSAARVFNYNRAGPRAPGQHSPVNRWFKPRRVIGPKQITTTTDQEQTSE